MAANSTKSPGSYYESSEQAVKDFNDPLWRLTNLYKISTEYGETRVFWPNAVQADIERRWTGRGIILKARQHGVSTYFLLRNLDAVLWKPNTWCAIIAHERRTLDILFQKIQYAWDNIPAEVKALRPEPRTDSKHELYWRELNSRIYVALEVVGGTNQIVHFSEYARMDDDKINYTLPTVPPDGQIIIESTPFGANNRFHREYLEAKRGENDYQPFFYEWWWSPKYRRQVKTVTEDNLTSEELALIENHKLDLEQIEWRRQEIKRQQRSDGTNLFAQEFVEDDINCLSSSARIGTSKGLIKISDVEVGSDSDHGKVVAKEYRGKKEVFEVTTFNGYRIRATSDHRLALANGEFCTVADSLNKEIKLQQPTLSDKPYVAKWNSFGGVENRLDITEDWASFIGYYMGDGSFFGDTLSLAFDSRDSDLLDNVKKLVSKLFNVDANIRKVSNGGSELRSSSKRYSDIFFNIDCIEINNRRNLKDFKRKICVPECIWKSPKNIVKQFLKYLFEAAGWTNPNRPVVKFFSKHKEFLEDIQLLLLTFNIASGIKYVERKLNDQVFPGYELNLRTLDAFEFHKQIGFVSKRKQNGYASDQSKLDKVKKAKIYNICDAVVKIESVGIEDVWDLQIDGEPVFSANGLLVHNCFLTSSESVFDVQSLEATRAHVAKNTNKYSHLKGYIASTKTDKPRFIEDSNGPLKIWEAPKFNIKYAVGVDLASGTSQGDFSTAQIIRCDTEDQVAEYKVRAELGAVAYEVAMLGKWYNTAYVCPERNTFGVAFLSDFLDLYPLNKIYQEDERIKIRKRSVGTKYGYFVGRRSKYELIVLLQNFVRDGQGEIRSLELIEEMMNLQKFHLSKLEEGFGTKNKYSYHDDLLMAFALALEMARHVPSQRQVMPNMFMTQDPYSMFYGRGRMGKLFNNQLAPPAWNAR